MAVTMSGLEGVENAPPVFLEIEAAVDALRVAAEDRAHDDDRESGEVFERVHRLPADDGLAEADCVGPGDEDRDDG